MKKIPFVLTLIVITFFAACSKKGSPGKRVKLTTYADNIVPLIQAKCTPCHMPSKGGNKANFENYETTKKYSADMLRRVMLNPGERGFMPFKHEKLPAEDVAVIKKWIDQGLLEK